MQACGSASWIAMLAAMVTIPLAALSLAFVIGRVRAATLLVGIAFVASFIPLGIGAFGMTLGRARVDSVLEGDFTPQQEERIRTVGYAEADGCMRVGIGASGPSFLVSVVALGLLLLRPPRKNSDPRGAL